MKQEEYIKYVQEVSDWSMEVRQLLEDNVLERSSEHVLQDVDQLFKNATHLCGNDEIDEREIRHLHQEVEAVYQMVSNLFQEDMRNDSSKRIKYGQHSLPPLPYRYDALEPYISEEIMRLHHDKHHQSYVDGLNKAERMLEKARFTNEYDLLKHWERDAAFHGSGHYLHTIFWTNMSPKGGGKPTDQLLLQINQDFGSFHQFKAHFSEAAKKVEGVGWALLVWAPRSHRLEILQTEKHQLMTQWDTIPLLVLDVWEHAYYLQYKNERGSYVENWWNVVNWQNVEERFLQASKLKWTPF